MKTLTLLALALASLTAQAATVVLEQNSYTKATSMDLYNDPQFSKLTSAVSICNGCNSPSSEQSSTYTTAYGGYTAKTKFTWDDSFFDPGEVRYQAWSNSVQTANVYPYQWPPSAPSFQNEVCLFGYAPITNQQGQVTGTYSRSVNASYRVYVLGGNPQQTYSVTLQLAAWNVPDVYGCEWMGGNPVYGGAIRVNGQACNWQGRVTISGIEGDGKKKVLSVTTDTSHNFHYSISTVQ